MASEEQAEPTTSAGMMKALAKASDGTNVIGESMKTFSMSEGKNKKGDVTVSQADMPAAVMALKAQVEAAKSTAKAKKAEMWDFAASPHTQMGKTLDDTFTAFLMWARLNKDDDEGEEEGEVAGLINVSKAFRRLESYAEWMQDSKADLLGGPMTYAACKGVCDTWCMSASCASAPPSRTRPSFAPCAFSGLVRHCASLP